MVCTTANWVRLQTWVAWSGGKRPSILDSNIKLTLISHLRIVRAIAANIFICTRYHWRNNENEMKIKTNYGSFHDVSHTLVVWVRHIVMRTRSHPHRTNCCDCDNMTALPTYYYIRNKWLRTTVQCTFARRCLFFSFRLRSLRFIHIHHTLFYI